MLIFSFNIYLFEFNLMHMSQGDEAGRSNNLQFLDDDGSETQPSKQKTQTLNKDSSSKNQLGNNSGKQKQSNESHCEEVDYD